jgi:uncharacterized membrane protein
MNTIHSNLPLYDASQNQPSLSRSLRNLSEQAKPASQPSQEPAASEAGSQAAEAPDTRSEIALQNQFSALADPAEAAEANKAAAASIASSPAAAVAAQSQLDAGAVRRLVSDE